MNSSDQDRRYARYGDYEEQRRHGKQRKRGESPLIPPTEYDLPHRAATEPRDRETRRGSTRTDDRPAGGRDGYSFRYQPAGSDDRRGPRESPNLDEYSGSGSRDVHVMEASIGGRTYRSSNVPSSGVGLSYRNDRRDEPESQDHWSRQTRPHSRHRGRSRSLQREHDEDRHQGSERYSRASRERLRQEGTRGARSPSRSSRSRSRSESRYSPADSRPRRTSPWRGPQRSPSRSGRDRSQDRRGYSSDNDRSHRRSRSGHRSRSANERSVSITTKPKTSQRDRPSPHHSPRPSGLTTQPKKSSRSRSRHSRADAKRESDTRRLLNRLDESKGTVWRDLVASRCFRSLNNDSRERLRTHFERTYDDIASRYGSRYRYGDVSGDSLDRVAISNVEKRDRSPNARYTIKLGADVWDIMAPV